MIDVKQEEDSSFTIYWDQNDPIESILNDWTEEDFIQCIMQRCEEALAAEKYIRRKSLNFNYPKVQESNYTDYNQTEENFYGEYSDQTRGESQKTYYIDQTAEEVQQDIDAASKFLETTEEDWKDFWGAD